MTFPTINKVVFPIGRITPNGTKLLGTAFMIDKPGMFVTAAHVTDNNDQNLVVIINNAESFLEYQDTTNTRVNSISAKIHATDPFNDICILKIQDTASSNVVISGADDCSPGDSVAIFGFPHADHGRMVLT